MNKIDRIKGCLIGGASGDALGYEVEFEKIKAIKKRYGINGITDFEIYDDKALISDDTQMTLFTAIGLLEAKSLDNDYLACIWDSYKDWYHTQVQKKSYKPNTQLYSLKELHNRRAPGHTCLNSIKSSKHGGTIDDPINMSKGCGGVMRVAPIGFLHNDNIEKFNNGWLGANVAALTHGHPMGYIPAACLSDLIHRIIYENDNDLERNIHKSILETMEAFAEYTPSCYMNEFEQLMKKAVKLSKEAIDDLDGIAKLGEGWIAEETLAIAVFSCLRHTNNFKEAIICAVNHNGDSDSTGSVAGNILGAYLGLESVSNAFCIEKIELYDVIMQISEKFI